MIENLSPERKSIADEARRRCKLPGIEAVRRLIIPGESVEDDKFKGESKNE